MLPPLIFADDASFNIYLLPPFHAIDFATDSR